MPSSAVSEESPGLLVDMFIFDQSPPELLNSTFDLNRGMLLLTFDEPISIETFNASRITIQSESADSSKSLQPQQARKSLREASIVSVVLSDDDVNAIKIDQFGTGVDLSLIHI